jgi:beta-phosphoglucomutase
MAFAVLFDMDGVIVDNNPFHKQAWVEFCKKYNWELSEENVEQYIYGRTNKDALTFLLKREATKEDVDRYGEEKEALYREIYREHLQPVPGLLQFLQNLKKEDARLAVATNAPKSNIDYTLELAGVKEYFNKIVDATYVSRGKPDPEIYLKAAELLGVKPEACIVVEDSLAGVQAGLNAGMKVIGITTTHSPEELSNTHLIINDFEGLKVEDLIKLLAS